MRSGGNTLRIIISMKMIIRLMRIRKVERLFDLPIEPKDSMGNFIDYHSMTKDRAEWKYIMINFR